VILTDLRYEAQLILECSCTPIPSDRIEHVSALLKRNLDWNYIFSVATHGGLMPLLSANLTQNFSGHLNPAVRDRLIQFRSSLTRKNLFLTLKLIEVVNELKKAGIPVLPFKGTTLAVQAYDSLALRQYCDLDLLVQPKHFDRATAHLSMMGYIPTSQANWIRRKVLFFTHKKDIVFVSEDSVVQIELHWKLSGSHFSMPLEISQLWRGLERLDLGGTEVACMPFRDLFVYLCLHGSRHEWERFAWICDLHQLIKKHGESDTVVDWIEIRNHARKHGCERVLELGLYLVGSFFGTRPNYPDYENVEKNAAFAEIAEQVRERVFSQKIRPSLKRDKYIYLLSLQEKRWHRIKLYIVYLTYYLRLLFTPNTLDRTIFPLPAFFHPLYFILRPVRLIFTYSPFESVKRGYLKK
jgi:hypothetical protein